MTRAGERFLATRLMSVLFSARVGAALALTVPPFWVLVAIAPAQWTHRLTQHWARVIVTLCGCRPIVTGLRSLPSGTGIVMVANHSSFIDSVVLLAAIPGDYRFVANHMAARRPLLGTIIRKSGHLVVERGSVRSRAACARAMVKTLQSGTSLLLFPEGHSRPARIAALPPGRISDGREDVVSGRADRHRRHTSNAAPRPQTA